MLGANLIKRKYDSIKHLDDLRSLISESKDGESSWFELKAINNQEQKSEKEDY